MIFNVSISSPSPLLTTGSIFFNGTSIWLQSGIPTSTAYVVNLDGTEYSYANGQPSSNQLFASPSLTEDTEHNVIIQPPSILDSIIIQMDAGDNADTVLSIDDSELFQEAGFSSKGKWTTNECLGSGRAEGTCHTSDGSGSEFTYEFEGDAITIWGAVESQSSSYKVSIDNLASTSYSPPNTTSARPITVLAHASNLGSGWHSISLTSEPKDGSSRIEIDSVQLYTKASEEGDPVPSNTSSSGSGFSALSKTTRIAIIGGCVCGAILLIALISFFVLTRKKRSPKPTASDLQLASYPPAPTHSNYPHGPAGYPHHVDLPPQMPYRPRDYDESTLAGSVVDMKKDGLESVESHGQYGYGPRYGNNGRQW